MPSLFMINIHILFISIQIGEKVERYEKPEQDILEKSIKKGQEQVYTSLQTTDISKICSIQIKPVIRNKYPLTSGTIGTYFIYHVSTITIVYYQIYSTTVNLIGSI